MLKKLLGTMAVLTLCANAQAGVIVGGTLGASSSDIKNAKYDDKVKNDDYSDSLKNAETWGIKLGYDFEVARTYISYDYASKDDHGKNSQENIVLSADYMYRVSNDVRLFAGLSGGYNRMKNETASYRGYKYDPYSYVYGGQIGMIYEFSSWQLEAGYRYLKHSTDEHEEDASKVFPQIRATDQAYIGLNYHF